MFSDVQTGVNVGMHTFAFPPHQEINMWVQAQMQLPSVFGQP